MIWSLQSPPRGPKTVHPPSPRYIAYTLTNFIRLFLLPRFLVVKNRLAKPRSPCHTAIGTIGPLDGQQEPHVRPQMPLFRGTSGHKDTTIGSYGTLTSNKDHVNPQNPLVMSLSPSWAIKARFQATKYPYHATKALPLAQKG